MLLGAALLIAAGDAVSVTLAEQPPAAVLRLCPPTEMQWPPRGNCGAPGIGPATFITVVTDAGFTLDATFVPLWVANGFPDGCDTDSDLEEALRTSVVLRFGQTPACEWSRQWLVRSSVCVPVVVEHGAKDQVFVGGESCTTW